MIESDFASVFGAKTVAPFQGQFDLGIETLDNAAGELAFGDEIVKEERAVGLEGTGHFLERLQATETDFAAPGIEEFRRPGWRAVGPKVLKGFDQKEGAKGAQRRTLNVLHAPTLTRSPVASLLEKDPTHLFEQGIQAGQGAGSSLLAPDIINGFVELFDDMKAVKDVQSLRQVTGGSVEVGLPHVGAEKADALAKLFSEDLEEVIEGGLGAVVSDPQQTLAVVVDLVNQSPEFVFLADMNLIDTESGDAAEITVLNAKIHNPFDRPIDICPSHIEDVGHLRPGQVTGPLRQKEAEDLAELHLSRGPGDHFDGDTTPATVHAPRRIDDKDGEGPERDEAPFPRRQAVVAGGFAFAPRTAPQTALAFADLNQQRLGMIGGHSHRIVHKSLDGMKLPE